MTGLAGSVHDRRSVPGTYKRRDDRRHTERYWTPERVLEALRAFGEAMGRAPTVNDTDWRSPYRRSVMSAARLQEAERAVSLGLKLPARCIVAREFGSWGAGIAAADFDFVPTERAKVQRTQRVKVRRTPRASQVCPSCGDFVSQIDELHGWCLPCVKSQTVAVPHLVESPPRDSEVGVGAPQGAATPIPERAAA